MITGAILVGAGIPRLMLPEGAKAVETRNALRRFGSLYPAGGKGRPTNVAVIVELSLLAAAPLQPGRRGGRALKRGPIRSHDRIDSAVSDPPEIPEGEHDNECHQRHHHRAPQDIGDGGHPFILARPGRRRGLALLSPGGGYRLLRIPHGLTTQIPACPPNSSTQSQRRQRLLVRPTSRRHRRVQPIRCALPDLGRRGRQCRDRVLGCLLVRCATCIGQHDRSESDHNGCRAGDSAPSRRHRFASAPASQCMDSPAAAIWARHGCLSRAHR